MQINLTVEALLRQYEDLRDNDFHLLVQVWKAELRSRGHDPLQITASTFLGWLFYGKLSSPESVRRSRQKLQELNLELRGKKYWARKQKGEDERRYHRGKF